MRLPPAPVHGADDPRNSADDGAGSRQYTRVSGRAFFLLIAALFFLPLDVRADATCLDAKALHGDVKTVLIRNGKVASDTDAPLNELHLWERWDISHDRQTVTVVQYSADDFAVLPLLISGPTTICEFDTLGRLVKSRLMLNGRNNVHDS